MVVAAEGLGAVVDLVSGDEPHPFASGEGSAGPSETVEMGLGRAIDESHDLDVVQMRHRLAERLRRDLEEEQERSWMRQRHRRGPPAVESARSFAHAFVAGGILRRYAQE